MVFLFFPSSQEVFRHVAVTLPGSKRDQILIEWRDGGTTATLIVKGRRISTTQAALDFFSGKPSPQFQRRGKDLFLVFWTGSGTSVAQNYVLVRSRTIVQKGGFEFAWSPHFAKDGIVFEYPRHETRRSDPRYRLRKTWRWSGSRQKFVLLGRRFVRSPQPA